MADRSSSLACKKFSPNVFDKNKCQNCFKQKDTHTEDTPMISNRPTTLEVYLAIFVDSCFKGIQLNWLFNLPKG